MPIMAVIAIVLLVSQTGFFQWLMEQIEKIVESFKEEEPQK